MRKAKNKTPSEPEQKARAVEGMRFRSVEMETVNEEGKEPIVRMSVSSEVPVLTYIRMGDQCFYAWEILDHEESSIDRSRCADGLVIQDTHYGDQVGLIRAPMIVNKKLGGIIEFCAGERAENIAADAAKGLRKNSSVGYMADSSAYVLEGEKDGYPLVRCKRWTPYEASFVNVPADVSVGVGRSLENNTPDTQGEKRNTEMTPKQIAEMYERAAKYGIKAEDVTAMIEAGKTRADLDALIVDKQERELAAVQSVKTVEKPAMPDAQRSAVPPVLGGNKTEEGKIVRQYSLMNIIRKAAGDDVDVGFEKEISQECRRLGFGSQRGSGGFVLPHAVLIGKRDFTVTGTSSASVATNLLANEYIDVLRTRSVLGALGVRFLPGLVGNIAIPKMSAGNTGYWVSESGAIIGSQPTLTQVTGTPHTCGVRTVISRRMQLQSTPFAEQLIRDEINERIIRTIQVAVFQGTGADGQPLAITGADGINNPAINTPGTPTYAELLGFPGAIMADNAEMDGQKWVFTAEVWQKLAATFTDGTAKAEHVLDYNSKTCLGYPYLVTEDVGANSAFFGAWASVMVGIWGAGIDLKLDDTTKSDAGDLILTGLQDVDVMVRNGQALAYNAAVTA